LLAQVIGREVAARLDAVFAPTVRVGYARQHMDLTGTLTLHPAGLPARVDFCCVKPDWGYVRDTPGKGEIGVTATRGARAARRRRQRRRGSVCERRYV
jgi:hypothetical protein